jgi:hypothetical protein
VGLERGPFSLMRIIEERLMAVGIRYADCALTSPICGGCLLAIVRLQTKRQGVCFVCVCVCVCLG